VLCVLFYMLYRIGEALDWADYLVVPSVWWENSPVTIREAYHCGVPVIASRLGALPEKVVEGVTGLLFTPGDADALARVLRRTLEEPDLLPALRRGLPPTVTMETHGDVLEGIYEELLREGARRGV
jgi:glycosyltransferase involved in cell wall biosynthesis